MMRTVTIDVGGLITPLSDLGVEKQLRRLPGVRRADVDYATASATVEYDDRGIDLEAIKAPVRCSPRACSSSTIRPEKASPRSFRRASSRPAKRVSTRNTKPTRGP